MAATITRPVEALDQLRARVEPIARELTGDVSDEKFLSLLKELHAMQLTMQATCSAAESQQQLADDLLSRPRR